jgi:hypothetical protein
MKIQNMLILLSLFLAGGMQAAVEVKPAAEGVSCVDRQVTLYNSMYADYYVKISEDIRHDSSDPVVWDGVPSSGGTAVTVPACRRLRVSVYGERPVDKQRKRALRLGYVFINPDDVKRLSRLDVVITVSPSGQAALPDHIELGFDDGSTKMLMLRK